MDIRLVLLFAVMPFYTFSHVKHLHSIWNLDGESMKKSQMNNSLIC
jgi:hypothetical protein